MGFVDSRTEQTSAVTDVLLALVALAGALFLSRLGVGGDAYKARIWSWAFGLLSGASLLGAVVHGIQMSEQLKGWLWKPINLALGLTVATFVVGVVYDRWGPAAAGRVLPIMVGVGTAFFGLTVVLPGTFLAFIVYEAAAVVFALAVYVLLAARQQLAGAAVMAAGCGITLVAAVVQARGAASATVIWEFDHNGIFHLIQIVGVVVLVAGLRMALLS